MGIKKQELLVLCMIVAMLIIGAAGLYLEHKYNECAFELNNYKKNSILLTNSTPSEAEYTNVLEEKFINGGYNET